MKTKIILPTLGIIVFLTITNPNIAEMKEHLGSFHYGSIIRRSQNFIIFSLYEYEYNEESKTLRYGIDNRTYYVNESHKITYIAVCKNFFMLSSEKGVPEFGGYR